MFGIQIKEQTIEKKKTGFVITNEEKNVTIMICCHRYHWHHWTGFLLCCAKSYFDKNNQNFNWIDVADKWNAHCPRHFFHKPLISEPWKTQLVGCIRLFQSLRTKSLVNKKIQTRDKLKLGDKAMCFLRYYTIGFHVEQELSIVLVLCI